MKLTVVFDRTIGRTIYRWHARVYRVTRGVVGHRSPVGPMLILETIGRTSGSPRAVTLLYYEDDLSYFVVASNGGRPEHPQWLRNVRAHPAVTVQVGAHRFETIAREIPSTNDPALWRELLSHYRGWGDYQKLTTRTISVVALDRTSQHNR